MNNSISQLQNHIENIAHNNGALLIGYTKIRKVDPVIILGFEYSDKWFFNFPYTLTKKLGKVYFMSKKVQDLIGIELKKEGYSAHNKTILSVYGDFRPLVVSAGLGDWGRNGLVVNDKYGSGILYAAVFTNAPFKAYSSSKDNSNSKKRHCIDCGECIASCPANAFDNGVFHTHRCLSYVVKGCSECLRSCKMNK